MSSTVFNAVYMAVDAPVWLAVTEAVNEVGLWDVGVNRAMWGAVIETVYGAVFWAVKEEPAHPALQDFLRPIEVET